MLSARTLLDRDGVTVSDVTCRHEHGRGDAEYTAGHRLVFVRRGCFVRRADGIAAVLDATVAYCANPGQEERYDHPHGGGDDCTSIALAPELVAALWGDAALPAGPLPTAPRLDLEQRLLLAAARRAGEPHELVERTVGLAAAVLERADPRRVAAGRPATVRGRRALADGAREALAADPDRPLSELARAVAVSPHHLTRVFRALTGHTIARHRMRLRTRAALERLAAGERDLARLAAELGFADQSHMCRVLRGETGRTPAALRAALAEG
ncbi:MAG TPA: AraC family transcriptional regulator [Solirubrobacteraceae bacterium]|jgi:AraC-like DNA-binding protein